MEHELRDGLAYVEAELRTIHEQAGDAPLDDDTQARFDEGAAYVTTTREALARLEQRQAEIARISDAPARPEVVERTAPNVIVQRTGLEVLEDRNASPVEVRDALLRQIEANVDDQDNQGGAETIVRRHATTDTRWARNLIARSTPEYVSAFGKYMTSPSAPMWTPEEQRALAVGTNTQGGFLMPTHLDPTIILTNNGSSNALRPISRVVTLTEGDTWYGVTSAGATASWDAELAEVSDDSPAVGSVNIPVYKGAAFIGASVEAFQDIAGLTSDVLAFFADAKDRLEGAAHATGTGSTQPTGIFTALDANTNVEIVSTTAATIGEVDIHSVYRQVPVRWRNRSTWIGHPLYLLAVKRLGTAVSSAFSGDLTMPVSDRILGRPVLETDDAPSTTTTTALDNELILGDFSNFVIVDKPGSASVEFIPHIVGGTANLPLGQRGWYMWFRGGSDSVNDVAFRLLQDKTSA